MGIWDTLFGNKEKFKQVGTKTPGQLQGLEGILEQLRNMAGQGGAYSGAQNYLSKILSGDKGALAEFEAPYRQEFEQQTIPGLAERFAGMNAMGSGLSSSGFGQALGGAGAQLQSQLAGLHGKLRQNASDQAFGQFNQLANHGLGTNTFENVYQPESSSLFGSALEGGAEGFGQLLVEKGLPILISLISKLFIGA